jgi:hypothetical protein
MHAVSERMGTSSALFRALVSIMLASNLQSTTMPTLAFITDIGLAAD